MNIKVSRRLKRGVGSVAAGLLLVASAGCDNFLEVENPGSLLDDDLERPELLATLANTPESNMAGTMTGLNTRSALLGDEAFHPRTQQENIDAMAGNRLAASSATENHWRDLAQGRFLADEVASRLASAGGSGEDIAKAHLLGGIARLAMADHYNVIVYDHEDSPRGPIQVINDAIAVFTQAAAAGGGNTQAAALGQLARAYRALYFEEMHLRGNTDASLFSQAESFALQALAAASDYNFSMEYGSPGGDNGANTGFSSLNQVSNFIDEIYLYLPDPVTGVWDPRIAHEDEVVSFFNGESAFSLKFPDPDTPYPLSRAAEAMLIIAENRILVGDLPGAVSWINQVRAAARVRTSASDWAGGVTNQRGGWPPATPISDLRDFASSDATEIYDQLKHERRAEFFMELRRWPDMRFYEIFPYRWLAPNVAQGIQLRWPLAPEEIATNENLTAEHTKSVFVN